TATVLKDLELKPDFDYTGSADGRSIRGIHRHLDDGELYFVDNQSDSEADIAATFRVTGKSAELWYSETGKMAPASFTIADGRTSVPLKLEPWGSVFVVFRKPATKSSVVVPTTTETLLTTVSGTWQLDFQQGRGAPASMSLDNLIPWNESTDKGVRYFSGVARYRNQIQVDLGWFRRGATYWVDLGEVKNLAIVSMNGRELGTPWHKPFRVDISSALKPGTNEITVQVVNAWVNRLVGDR